MSSLAYDIIQTGILCISVTGKGPLTSNQHLNKRVYVRFITEPDFKAASMFAKSPNEHNFSCYCILYMIQSPTYTFWRLEESQPHNMLRIKIAVQNVESQTHKIHENSSDTAARMTYSGFVIWPSGHPSEDSWIVTWNYASAMEFYSPLLKLNTYTLKRHPPNCVIWGAVSQESTCIVEAARGREERRRPAVPLSAIPTRQKPDLERS